MKGFYNPTGSINFFMEERIDLTADESVITSQRLGFLYLSVPRLVLIELWFAETNQGLVEVVPGRAKIIKQISNGSL